MRYFKLPCPPRLTGTNMLCSLNVQTTNVAKMVSAYWKSMSAMEREVWEEKARKDRARYEAEVLTYKGPWKVLAKREKKPHDAPKRPMSAFLSFSNKRRSDAMKNNPGLSQAEISALLSKMWNDAPAEIRDEHIKKEQEARLVYKKAIAIWREKDSQMKSKERSDREAKAQETVDSIANTTLTASASRPEQVNLLESDSMISVEPSPLDSRLFSSVSGAPQESSVNLLSQKAYSWARHQEETLEQVSSLHPIAQHQYHQQQTDLTLANMIPNMWAQQQQSSALWSRNAAFQQPQMGLLQRQMALQQQRSGMQSQTDLLLDASSSTSLQHQLLQLERGVGGVHHQMELQHYQREFQPLPDPPLDHFSVLSHQHQPGAAVGDVHIGANFSNSNVYTDGDGRALDWGDFPLGE